VIERWDDIQPPHVVAAGRQPPTRKLVSIGWVWVASESAQPGPLKSCSKYQRGINHHVALRFSQQ
jgi:hypothetical protein